MLSAMCSSDLIATLRGGPYNIVTQLRDNPSCMLTLTLVNARGRDGTQAPQSWADTCFSKKTKASPSHLRGIPADVTFPWSVNVTLSERLTRHSLCWGCDTLSYALISWHVAWSHDHHLAAYLEGSSWPYSNSPSRGGRENSSKFAVLISTPPPSTASPCIGWRRWSTRSLSPLMSCLRLIERLAKFWLAWGPSTPPP